MRVRLLLTSMLLLAGGCGGTGQPFVTPARLDQGLVVVLTGIHGRLWLSEDIGQGLSDGGVQQAVEIYDWTYYGHWFPFYNLGALERNHAEAKKIAQHISAYHAAHPGRPVTLVGYSGGGPLAVWTAEAMAERDTLDGIVLLSAPLVPEYNLTKALQASRKGIVSFYSNRDILYLGLGTLVFGTMDKQNVISAGNLGFHKPARTTPASQPAAREPAIPVPAMPDAMDLAYEKLFQIPWQSPMADLGYAGSHLTIGAPRFIAAYVSPLVNAPRWDKALVERIANHGKEIEKGK